MKLTQVFVKRAICEENKPKQVFYDDDIKGFILEVKSNGRKTFYLRTIGDDKKSNYTKIADASILPCDEARTKAIKLKRSIEEGKDVIIGPINNKTRSNKFNSNVITLCEFFEMEYLPYIKSYSKSWSKNNSIFTHHILPNIGNIPMDKITSSMVFKIHNEMRTIKQLSNAMANKIIIYLRHIYNLAISWKTPGIVSSPAAAIKLLEEKHKECKLDKVQTRKLMKAVYDSNNHLLRYIIPFLILTGARRMEALSAKWEDVDLVNKIWTIPITKNKKIRKIPISDKLYSLINQIPKDSTVYLFPSPRLPNRHIEQLHRTWDKARCSAGMPELRLHDLRHSFASALINNGRSLYEVQKLLGHSDIKMTQRYAHLSDASLMNAVSCAQKLLG